MRLWQKNEIGFIFMHNLGYIIHDKDGIASSYSQMRMCHLQKCFSMFTLWRILA